MSADCVEQAKKPKFSPPVEMRLWNSACRAKAR